MLVDSHAHLDDARFNEDREAVIQRAWDAGIRRILTIGNGSGPDSMGCGIPIAEKYDWIFTSVGVHPHDAAKLDERHVALMDELAAHPKVLAIGETGLDYHYDNSPRDIQHAVFRRQIEVAAKLDLPVIVHTREADDDTIEILKQMSPRQGILHCFTSGDALADVAVEMGFMISFSGIVTFPNARRLAETARRVPSHQLLIETDCPYLAPIPHRGRRNEPSFVAETGRFLAAARGVSFETLQTETSANFARLFSLPKTS